MASETRWIEHAGQGQAENLRDFPGAGPPVDRLMDDTDHRRNPIAGYGIETIEQTQKFDGPGLEPDFFAGFAQGSRDREALAGLGPTAGQSDLPTVTGHAPVADRQKNVRLVIEDQRDQNGGRYRASSVAALAMALDRQAVRSGTQRMQLRQPKIQVNHRTSVRPAAAVRP